MENVRINTYIIGISAYYHDSSACLFKNGELVFACEEEKFTGIKHDSSFPFKTIDYIFKKFKLNKSNIEAVCYYEDIKLKEKRVFNNIKTQFFKNPIYCIKSLYNFKKNAIELKTNLKNISDNVFYSKHHESHLYYSYYTSNFSNSISLSVDGVGEVDTIAVGVPYSNTLQYTSIAEYPHSLGLFYSAMTSFLGFRPNEGEYKVMGLASYGNPNKYIDQVRKLISFKNGKLICNLNVFVWNRSNKVMFNEKLGEILGIEQRLPEEELLSVHQDLAASVQMRYEEVLFDILKTLSLITDSNNLCLSGGCAYNGTANGKITTNTSFNHLWIPPAPSDAGSAIGACVNYMVNVKKVNKKISKNPFLGPQYFYENALRRAKPNKIKKFYSVDKMVKHIAQQIKNGKVIGWYQGHCEFGARALGNRSILADPTADGMKDRINKVIKKREGFRPFAPMVTKEKQDIFFEIVDDIPYMNQVVKVKPEYINKLKAVTHVDGTARVQTVYAHTLIHDLLLEFEKISNYPILLNTSFNVKDKTMVLTPKDALETFYDTEMDILVMGGYVIYK